MVRELFGCRKFVLNLYLTGLYATRICLIPSSTQLSLRRPQGRGAGAAHIWRQLHQGPRCRTAKRKLHRGVKVQAVLQVGRRHRLWTGNAEGGADG